MTGTRDQYHHGNLREALIDAACGVVAEGGVGGLSMRAVARRAGVSQAAPYHHFEGKEALVAAVCQRGFSELSERIEQAISAKETPREKLRAMGEAYLLFSRERPVLFGIMWGGKGLLEDKTPYLELMSTSFGTFEKLLEVIQAGIASGDFEAADPMDAALATWAAVHGAASLAQDGGLDNPPMQEMGATPDRVGTCVLDLIFGGLKRHE